MDNLIFPGQLASRILALNLTHHQVAARAGIHHVTLGRIIGGGNCEMQTLVQVSRVVVEEEKRLLAYLRVLHPDEVAA